ncbi:MAG: hypothetical protein HDS84_05965 [Bacteroidales bacterium]|nr:hypothetical protein [Bacteroidales bacterium]
MKKIVVAGLGACAFALAFAAKDPVIMKVNGVDVPKSEFEYLYNKNSQQQINPQSLDEYVEMFKLYKMKVADARAEGIDTTAAFLKETEQYRHDLAAPYLADSVFLNNLVQEAYDRSKEEVEAYHIMLFKTRNLEQNRGLRQRADSILQALNKGGDFTDLATRFSQDRSSSNKGGRMGWITAGSYPLAFELEAWALPEGEISAKVVESPVGYHILKGGKHRPARGKASASHILRLTQGKDDAGKLEARRVIDSLYNEVTKNPELFARIAAQNSEDRNSARQGGALPLFGAGEMVEPFDSATFALEPGQISGVVETSYGYHIIKLNDKKPIPSKNEIKPIVLQRVTSPQDPRYRQIRDNQISRLSKKHKSSLNKKTIDELRAAIQKNGIDSALFADWTTMPKASMPVLTVDGKSKTAADLVNSFGSLQLPASDDANEFVDNKINSLYAGALTEAEENDLENTQPDYRNLLKEYVDGSLLYEVSVMKVWDKAAKDTEGLEKYFEANRDNYKWTDPHVKGFLIQAANDSVADKIRALVVDMPENEIVNAIRKEFKNDASVDRVLASKGTNQIIDYLIFGGPKVNPSNNKYTSMFMINPRVILEPEEVNDVKGLVTSDYQNEFQQAWENELRAKYPVEVNEKVLNQIRKQK